MKVVWHLTVLTSIIISHAGNNRPADDRRFQKQPRGEGEADSVATLGPAKSRRATEWRKFCAYISSLSLLCHNSAISLTREPQEAVTFVWHVWKGMRYNSVSHTMFSIDMFPVVRSFGQNRLPVCFLFSAEELSLTSFKGPFYSTSCGHLRVVFWNEHRKVCALYRTSPGDSHFMFAGMRHLGSY